MMSWMLLLFLTAAPLSAQTLSVVHKKDFWRDGRGTIEITKEAVIYQARKQDRQPQMDIFRHPAL